MASTMELKAIITAKDEASGKINDVGNSASKLGSILTKLGIAAGVMAIALGTKAVMAAASFEKKMANVSTLIDTNSESMKEMSQAVLDLSKKIPVSADELATALYDIRSAGIDASDAMNVLEASAKLAVAGLGTTTEAVDLVTSSLNAFASQGWDAAQITDIVFTAVKAGKTTVSELAQGFGAVAGQVENAGIQLDDYFASIAAVTTQGVPAAQAHTMIRAALAGLTRETAESTRVFGELGVKTFPELIKQEGGLVPAFKRIKDIVGDNDAELLKLVGSVEGMNALLSLSGPTNDAYTTTLADMRDGVANVDEAFEKQKATFDATWQLLKNNLNVALITLGNMILPPLISAISWLIETVNNVVNKVRQWFTETEAGQAILNLFKSMIEEISYIIKDWLIPQLKELWETHGPAIKKALEILAIIFGSVLLVAIVAVIGVIAAIILIISGLITAFNWLTETINKVITWFTELAFKIVYYVTYAGIKVQEWIHNMVIWFLELPGKIGDALVGIYDAIVGAFKTAFAWVEGKINALSDSLSRLLNKASFGLLGRKQAGGSVTGGMPYMVGEAGPELFVPSSSGTIVPNNQISNAMTVNIYGNINNQQGLTPDEIAETINRQVELSKMGAY